MIVKNVLKQGYPFAEAIASALPICDEFLISDGYSTDGTFEILKQISSLNKKIRIFRYKWPETKNLAVLGEVTNALRHKCRFNYIFYVQANEVIHEANIELIKALPEMMPTVYTFSFPYIQLIGTYKITEERRLRFSKNLKGIVAIGDAWTLGPSRAFIISEMVKNLKNPRRLLSYFGSGIALIYANYESMYSKAIYLPKPIFKYWSIFPRDFLEKSKSHAEMFNLPEYRKIIENLKTKIDDQPSFWEAASALIQTALPLGIKYPGTLGILNKEEHPKIMQDLILNPRLNRYHVREEILELMASL
jgi:glycosyltransferase involved in cell wall biosynthesis